MTTTSTPAPTLSTDWAPTASGCLRKSDLWVWQYSDIQKDARTVLGGPSQTTACFSSEWTATLTYAGSGCPAKYTPACTNGDAVTCCPDLYSFTCDKETWSVSTTHGDWFRCVSQWDSQTIDTLTKTDFVASTIKIETRTRHPNQHLFALALLYTPPPPSSTSSLPTSSSDPTPTETPSGNSNSGLTPAAAGGIGAGVGAAAVLLGVIGWIWYRRRKASNVTPPTPGTSSAHTYNPDGSYGQPHYLTQPFIPPAPKQPAKELHGDSAPVFELPGDANEQHNRLQ
ncbi:hypothetical protein F5B22DRAFT_298728 [Xylaria bambusicola]|uniref:uncharacterized protein n=1 Tax=Xylaria bambusicola TaxID=326684 RepID=UPI0020085330|nr:uncharacterized protein F5B22DRAFT_298728 [Xylaria bambusicola]KAI0512618.1 hypothetical protein F5B22DRAFT_298728 [Xylaria bambusicola]